MEGRRGKAGTQANQTARRPPDATGVDDVQEVAAPPLTEDLFEVVYTELRAIAARHLDRERDAHTFQPTGLVHEAYLRLVGSGSVTPHSRIHFLRLASRAMRQVLVDAARRRNAKKHGGGLHRVTLESDLVPDEASGCDVLGLHEALERLGREDEQMERLVELRFFTGMTLDEAADALGISRRTAASRWAGARIWLRRELTRE